MSQGSTDLTSCPDLQEDLFTNFTECDPTTVLAMHESSFVQYLTSGVNTNGTLQRKISPGRGKRRQVELLYTPRMDLDDFSSTPAKVCVSTKEVGDCSELYTIEDVGLQYDEKFDLLNLRDACKDNPLIIAQHIQRIMNGAIRKMEVDLVQDLTTLTGNFGAGEENVAAQIKTIQSKLANGNPDPYFAENVDFAAKNAAYCSIPYAFGYHESFRAFKRAEDAGCCADGGLNIAEMSRANPMVFMPNSQVDSQFGTNHFVIMAAGATQILFWNEFMGENGINVIDDQAYKQTVLVDPLTSIPFDFQWTNDCGDIMINIKLAYKLVGMPDDMYPTGDHHDGVTMVNEFLISNP